MLERFASETAVEHYIRSLIEEHITRINPNIYALKNKKAVDILICRDGKQPALFFIEVKYHQVAHGRVGFGGKEGAGFQPEIVLRAPAYFEKNLRWILASDRHIGRGVLFVHSKMIREYLSGGIVGEKFNNIRSKIFDELPLLSEAELIKELRQWLDL